MRASPDCSSKAREGSSYPLPLRERVERRREAKAIRVRGSAYRIPLTRLNLTSFDFATLSRSKGRGKEGKATRISASASERWPTPSSATNRFQRCRRTSWSVASFDHLVGAAEQRRRHLDAERFGR